LAARAAYQKEQDFEAAFIVVGDGAVSGGGDDDSLAGSDDDHVVLNAQRVRLHVERKLFDCGSSIVNVLPQSDFNFGHVHVLCGCGWSDSLTLAPRRAWSAVRWTRPASTTSPRCHAATRPCFCRPVSHTCKHAACSRNYSSISINTVLMPAYSCCTRLAISQRLKDKTDSYKSCCTMLWHPDSRRINFGLENGASQ
jgi:hypothetical protein